MSSRPPATRLILLLILLALVIGVAFWNQPRRTAPRTAAASPRPGLSPQQLAAAVTALETRENQIAETVWAKDLLAGQGGAVFERLWDRLNTASNKLELATAFPVEAITPPAFNPPQILPHGIHLLQPSDRGGTRLDAGDWATLLQRHRVEGWELEQVEFRHHRFETDPAGAARQSHCWFSAHLTNPGLDRRAALSGDLIVDWRPDRDVDGLPRVGHIDATRLTLLTRDGPAPFRLVLDEPVRPPPRSHFIDPLLVHDLDGDGGPELILASANVTFRWKDGRFERVPFCRDGPGLIFTGVLEDFDGDGFTDFLAVGIDGLTLFKRSSGGEFVGPGLPAWEPPARIRYGQVLTCGDVDGDGDLDVWLGQYKNPYDGGQMPTPYYDANDGNPAYLLLNDGSGRFSDATEAGGLGSNRWRRTYSASLVDLDGDGDLDLFVVSDFAGVEVYDNNGGGHFTDSTAGWIVENKAFGMSHVFADFNADGHLDFLVTGMHCPTASRLDGLGLSRLDSAHDPSMRERMTRGNLLRIGRPGGGFAPGLATGSIARSGWSWGCVAEDFDNDGFVDVAITNGHETRRSTAEYEPEFWRHDIHVATSREDAALNAYFRGKFGRTRGHGVSYGGWEKNRFHLSQSGTNFLEVGHLFGLALEADSRNLAAADFDGDGRVDLAVTTFEAWPVKQQTLKVYRNELPETGDWVEVTFPDHPNRGSAIGAQVIVQRDRHTTVRPVVTGDTHRAQQSGRVHAGLGSGGSRATVTIRWADSSRVELSGLEPNRRHSVVPPRRHP
ncbi:MAG: CRTAC1 family protein [Limisphaerales bacterium]